MTKQTLNATLITESLKNLIHLLKSTTSNEEEFTHAFKSLLTTIREEFQSIKLSSYELNQAELATKQNEILSQILDELGIKLATTQSKKKSPPKNPKWEESIMVAPRKELFDNERLASQGVIQDKEVVDEIIENLSNTYTSMRRGAIEDKTAKSKNAEINTDYKQPIPYVLIKREDEIFVYERLVQGGESRLHNKLSLGVGGHINPIDKANFSETLSINLQRELDEELTIKSDESLIKYLGLINDDEDEVGRVHLGILAINELSPDAVVEVKETDQLKGEWMTIEQLKSPEVYDRLENWSKISVDIL